MPRTVSSAQTFLAKFLFPVMWIGGFASATAGMFFNELEYRGTYTSPVELKWTFLVMTILGSAFIYWGCMRLKRVAIDGDALIISNYFKSVAVPLRELVDVTENRWINIHPVTLTFREATPFGKKVVFMPKTRWLGAWVSHPVVAELRTLAALSVRR